MDEKVHNSEICRINYSHWCLSMAKVWHRKSEIRFFFIFLWGATTVNPTRSEKFNVVAREGREHKPLQAVCATLALPAIGISARTEHISQLSSLVSSELSYRRPSHLFRWRHLFLKNAFRRKFRFGCLWWYNIIRYTRLVSIRIFPTAMCAFKNFCI